MTAPTPASTPLVSVVCPVRDEGRRLSDVLSRLLGGDYPAARMEVLVAVAPSRDDTAEVVRSWARRDARVRPLDNPTGTTPAGLNAGLRAARGDVIVRLDGHALPERDYVRACTAALARTGAWAVGGPMVLFGDTAFGRAVAAAMAGWAGTGGAAYRSGKEGPVDTVYLGAWPRWVFERVGPFDERLVKNQDYELCLRVRAAGGTVWLDPRIRTRTLARGSPTALARQYFGYGRGRSATLERHPSSLRARQALPASLPVVLGALTAAAPRSTSARKAGAGMVAGYVGLLLHAAGRAARDEPPAVVARVPLALAIAHGAWAAGFWWGWLDARVRRNG